MTENEIQKLKVCVKCNLYKYQNVAFNWIDRCIYDLKLNTYKELWDECFRGDWLILLLHSLNNDAINERIRLVLRQKVDYLYIRLDSVYHITMGLPRELDEFFRQIHHKKDKFDYIYDVRSKINSLDIIFTYLEDIEFYLSKDNSNPNLESILLKMFEILNICENYNNRLFDYEHSHIIPNFQHSLAEDIKYHIPFEVAYNEWFKTQGKINDGSIK